MAAGRWRSAATRHGLRPWLASNESSLPQGVVLPDPCRPAEEDGRRRPCVERGPRVAGPISSISSSWTILHDLLAGPDALQHLARRAPARPRVSMNVLDDLDVDVGLEQREADLAHGARDRLLVQASLLAEVAERALKAL